MSSILFLNFQTSFLSVIATFDISQKFVYVNLVYLSPQIESIRFDGIYNIQVSVKRGYQFFTIHTYIHHQREFLKRLVRLTTLIATNPIPRGHVICVTRSASVASTTMPYIDGGSGGGGGPGALAPNDLCHPIMALIRLTVRSKAVVARALKINLIYDWQWLNL